MNPTIRAVISWALVPWPVFIFLTSIPYKFSRHPDTQHIFGTIGDWLGGLINPTIGKLFADFGPYAIGSFELLTAFVLLLPALLWVVSRIRGHGSSNRAQLHTIGGLMAAAVMGGAVFFHLLSPLGIEVLHEGQSDGGSLFYAAVSILISGTLLFLINRGVKSSVI